MQPAVLATYVAGDADDAVRALHMKCARFASKSMLAGQGELTPATQGECLRRMLPGTR